MKIKSSENISLNGKNNSKFVYLQINRLFANLSKKNLTVSKKKKKMNNLFIQGIQAITFSHQPCYNKMYINKERCETQNIKYFLCYLNNTDT